MSPDRTKANAFHPNEYIKQREYINTKPPAVVEKRKPQIAPAPVIELKNFGTVNKKELKLAPEKEAKKKINLEIMQAMPDLSPDDRRKALDKLTLDEIKQLQQDSPTQQGCESPLLKRVKKDIQQTKSAIGTFLGGFGIKPMKPANKDPASKSGNVSRSSSKPKDGGKPSGLAGLMGGFGAPMDEVKEVKEVKETTVKPGASKVGSKTVAKVDAKTAPKSATKPVRGAISNTKPKSGARTPVKPAPAKSAKPSTGKKGVKKESQQKTAEKPELPLDVGVEVQAQDISEIAIVGEKDVDPELKAVLDQIQAPEKKPAWYQEEEEEEQVEGANENVYSKMKLLANYMTAGSRRKRRVDDDDDEDF